MDCYYNGLTIAFNNLPPIVRFWILDVKRTNLENARLINILKVVPENADEERRKRTKPDHQVAYEALVVGISGDHIRGRITRGWWEAFATEDSAAKFGYDGLTDWLPWVTKMPARNTFPMPTCLSPSYSPIYWPGPSLTDKPAVLLSQTTRRPSWETAWSPISDAPLSPVLTSPSPSPPPRLEHFRHYRRYDEDMEEGECPRDEQRGKYSM